MAPLAREARIATCRTRSMASLLERSCLGSSGRESLAKRKVVKTRELARLEAAEMENMVVEDRFSARYERHVAARTAEARLQAAETQNMMVADRFSARYERHVAARTGDDGEENHFVGWRTIYVFISSTFRDMHAERNVMTQEVFPALNDRAKRRRVQVVPIDLRWGLTPEQCQQAGATELCLVEVERSTPFFVALMASRYGWCPDDYDVSDKPSLAWVKEYPPKRSITELEIMHGFLGHQLPRHAFTYIRDPSFLSDVESDYIGTFTCGAEKDSRQLGELIEKMKAHPFNQTMDQYPCTWDKGHDPPQLAEASLHEFRDRMLEDLWEAIDFECPPLPAVDSLMVERQEHQLRQTERAKHFASRRALLHEIGTKLKSAARGAVPLTLVDQPGSGKSALLARVVQDFVRMRRGPNPNPNPNPAPYHCPVVQDFVRMGKARQERGRGASRVRAVGVAKAETAAAAQGQTLAKDKTKGRLEQCLLRGDQGMYCICSFRVCFSSCVCSSTGILLFAFQVRRRRATARPRGATLVVERRYTAGAPLEARCPRTRSAPRHDAPRRGTLHGRLPTTSAALRTPPISACSSSASAARSPSASASSRSCLKGGFRSSASFAYSSSRLQRRRRSSIAPCSLRLTASTS